MTQVKWINGAGGDFANGANWSTGTVPGASDDAVFMLAGPYTVTSSQNETVNSVQMVQGITLSIAGGTFDASNGSGSGADNGLIAVANNAEFQAGGTIAGTGTIQLNSIGNGTSLTVLDAGLTLSGGGKVVLSDNGQNYFRALTAGDKLTNVNDIISGAGQFAYNNMSFTNDANGVLNANAAANALVINAGTGIITNAGLFEATGAAGLDIYNSAITQTGTGTIEAVGAGHNVSLDGGSITGGTLTTTGGGMIQSVSNGYLTDVTITAGSTIAALNNQYLHVNGTITNKGTIALNSAGNGTRLQIDSGTLTLTGGGAVVLTDNTQNYIFAGTAGNLLVNVNNTISGAGQLTYNHLAFDNRAAGVIEATGTVNALVVDTGGAAFSNEGLLEDTGAAGLAITDGTVIVNTGTILATGAGSHVDLNTGSIQGGTLATTAGGVIQSVSNFELDGSTAGAITITAHSQIAVLNNEYLTLAGTIVNGGTIALDSAGSGTRLQINGVVSLTGGGVVTLSDSTQNYLYSINQTDTLVNVNNTISGSGQLGINYLTIDNRAAGIINSTGATGMTVDTGGKAFTNAGLIEDTGAGGFTLLDNTTIANTGTIAAIGTMASVDLTSGTIRGGTVRTSNGGVIQITSLGTFDGMTAGALTLTAGSQVAVLNSQYLTLEGTIANHGTIALDSAGSATRLQVSGTAYLTGGGAVVLSDNSQNYLFSINQSDTLVNVNNTISGSGQLGHNYLTIDNQAAGIINSTGAAGMAVDTGGRAFFNEGLIEDTGAGGFTLLNSTTISNTGTIAAIGAGASVDLYQGTIQGGTVSTSSGGAIQITSLGTFDGKTAGALTITAGSQVAVLNSQYLTLEGTIANHGTIALDSTGNATRLQINGTASLTGGGTVALSDNTQNYLFSINQTDTLVNVNNTITGSGILGYNYLTIDNQAAGIINASGAAGIDINPGGRVLTNEGTLEASGTGGLFIQATTLTNTGTIAALSDSVVTINSDATLTNYGAGTLTGGTYEAISAGGTHAATLTINSIGPITVDAATLVLSGVGSSIIAGGTAVDTSLTTVASKGKLEILNGRVVTAANALGNSGTILLSGTLSETSLTNYGVGVISGVGTSLLSVAGSLTNRGVIQANGGKLTVGEGKLTNTGTVQALAASTLTFGKSVANTNLVGGTLTGGTWAAIGNGATLALASGPIAVDAATLTLSAPGSVIQSGTVLTALESTLTTIAATGVLNLLDGRGFASTTAGGVRDAGSIILGGGTFGASGLAITGSFAGTGAITGPVTDNGTLTTGGPATGTLTVKGAVTGTGALRSTAGDTLTASGGYAVGSVSVAAGSTFNGAGSATGAIAIAGTLAMNGGTLSGGSISVTGAAGLLTGNGTVVQNVANAGTIDASGGTLALTGGQTGGVLAVEAGAALVADAAIAAASLTIAAGGSFVGLGGASGATIDNGSLTASRGDLSIAALSGTGSATIAANATLTLSNPLTLAGGLTFAAGGADVLSLAGPSGTSAVLTGFANGDTIDIRNTVVTGDTFKNGVLTLKSGTTRLGTLKFVGSYTRANFTLTGDGHGGTDIVYAAGAAIAANPLQDLQTAAMAANAPSLATDPQAAGSFGGEPQGAPAGWADPGVTHPSDLLAAHLFHIS